MLRRSALPLALALALVTIPGATSRSPAELVLRNGRIVTMDDARPECQAVAMRGDTIVALGTDQEMAAWIGSRTRVIDLRGRLAIPGFIESHGHFMGLGRSLTILRLASAKNWDEIVALVERAAKSAKPGDWIVGRGWHQEKWDRSPVPSVEGFPTHDALSRAAPRNPVMLTHASGHAEIVNAKALELAGITRATPDPPGGEILRDKDDEATGVLRENAGDPVERALQEWRARRSPKQAEADAIHDIELASEECLSKGVTTFQDAGSPLAVIDRFDRLARKNKLRIRLWVMAREDNDQLEKNLPRYQRLAQGNHRLAVRAIKRQIDGALGSRGAWLLADYSDSPDKRGLNTATLEDLERTARLAADARFQLCIHAIGDRANREVLDLYQKIFREHSERKDWRWRIEHAQHLAPSDIPRFGELGVIASVQGVHCTSDGPWVPARLGDERSREGAYVWRKLLESKAVVINGTDAPVEDVNPVHCFHSTVTRLLPDGKSFYPEQRLTRLEALRSYTRDAAFAAFQENSRGSLAVGKLADVTVLSKDILTIPEPEILEARVDYTIVGGKVAFARKSASAAGRPAGVTTAP